MSCDPLASASLGIFTCASENCNPCTMASLGIFTFGDDADDDSGGHRVHKKYLDALDDFNLVRAVRRRVERDGVVADIESKPFITPTKPAIRLESPSVSDIKDTIDKEIAIILRTQAIKEQTQKVIDELKEQDEFDETVILILLTSEM